jgi:methionyl-tRNA formyltransferase
MKILFLGNNWVAWKILEYLKEHQESIVGLVIHGEEKQKFSKELIRVSGLPENKIFIGTNIQSDETINQIRELKPDIALSIFFDYILPNKFINIIPKGVINLHPAYLPFNRGQYPNVWSIIEGTPSGITLHYIDDKKIDSGDIISQREVPIEPIDTGMTLYRKLEFASVQIFQDTWPAIKNGEIVRRSQNIESGTYHRTRDVEKIDKIFLDKKYTGKELINILRARTFPPYKGAYFEEDGKRVYMSLGLEYDKDEHEK